MVQGPTYIPASYPNAMGICLELRLARRYMFRHRGRSTIIYSPKPDIFTRQLLHITNIPRLLPIFSDSSRFYVDAIYSDKLVLYPNGRHKRGIRDVRPVVLAGSLWELDSSIHAPTILEVCCFPPKVYHLREAEQKL